MFTLFLCLNSFFLRDTAAQADDEPVGISANYTFETINVPGVQFLAVTASSDFEDYAGNTKSADGERDVAFVAVPEASETYADFVNAIGRMVGSYIDAEGIYHAYIRTPTGRFRSCKD